MDIWKDGRTGAPGQIAGNLALADLSGRSGEKITHRRGTTFVARGRLYIGRVCGSAEYLVGDEAHFCNLSPTQFAREKDSAAKEHRELFLLCVTATPEAVHYWCIPRAVVGRVLRRMRVKPSDESCAIKIRQKEGRFLMEDQDVTEYHTILALDESVANSLSIARAESQGSSHGVMKPRSSGDTGTPDEVRLQRIFRHGDGLACLLPPDVVAQTKVAAGSLVHTRIVDGAILLRPVQVVPELQEEDQRFVDELYRRRRRVFEALGK